VRSLWPDDMVWPKSALVEILDRKNVELMGFYSDLMFFLWDINETYRCHWIGLRENLRKKPYFLAKKHGFL